MNQQDKKFLCALVFAQTSVLSFLIVASPYYWIKEANNWERIREKANKSITEQTKNIKTETKVKQIKNLYRHQNIGVEENY